MRAWAHLHLPRLRSGETDQVISLKVPGQRIDYVTAVALKDVEFKVHESGRQRCIRDGVRNVHAWLVGEIDEVHHTGVTYILDARRYRQAVYDPWKGGTFVDAETLEPVLHSTDALLIGKDVFYRTEEAA
ncbi:hypothetical protein KGG70_gp12 [Streptomyces phage Celia]|uniref:Uncharacterized protein n=1 Tax=Streptomyces phage Celia TaxID=2590946 RepID=A0A516KRF9_9CAUD|nr:hypothetical protein KGG70_gp12 [Streptomyces phage Celia]QDP44272.1 hypothetical protein SEA_CELIA_69 [Streptomyces phage Celia]